MTARIRKFSRISARERRLLIGASILLAVSRLVLWVVPFRFVWPYLSQTVSEREATDPRHPTASYLQAGTATGLLLACAVSLIANPCRPSGEGGRPRRAIDPASSRSLTNADRIIDWTDVSLARPRSLERARRKFSRSLCAPTVSYSRSL